MSCGAGEKPLALLHVLERHGYTPTLCFTNSIEACHRLCRLLQVHNKYVIACLRVRQVRACVCGKFVPACAAVRLLTRGLAKEQGERESKEIERDKRREAGRGPPPHSIF